MARVNIFGARKAEIKRPMHFYHSRIHTYPALLARTSLRSLASSTFSSSLLFRPRETRTREQAFLVHNSRARNLSSSFRLDTYLKHELISLFEEFCAILSPNNIFARDVKLAFALARIQVFIFYFFFKRQSLVT